MKKIILVLAILVAAAAVLYLIPRKSQAPSNSQSSDVVDFETCADAGYPIAETDPATCATPDGRTFTELAADQSDASVLVPQPDALVTSPLHISGSAINSWYFEASFPAQLKDANGNVIAQGPMQAQSDWTATGQVPFTGTLTWDAQPQTTTGFLILSKDNPSGLPQNDSSMAVPVRFK